MARGSVQVVLVSVVYEVVTGFSGLRSYRWCLGFVSSILQRTRPFNTRRLVHSPRPALPKILRRAHSREMPLLQDFEAWVEVGGTKLQEYKVEENATRTEAVCWIPCEPGKVSRLVLLFCIEQTRNGISLPLRNSRLGSLRREIAWL